MKNMAQEIPCITVDMLRPFVQDFFKSVSLKKWKSLGLGNPDEDTKTRMFELLMKITEVYSTSILPKFPTDLKTNSDYFFTTVSNTVSTTFTEVLGVGEHFYSRSREIFDDIFIQHVTKYSCSLYDNPFPTLTEKLKYKYTDKLVDLLFELINELIENTNIEQIKQTAGFTCSDKGNSQFKGHLKFKNNWVTDSEDVKDSGHVKKTEVDQQKYVTSRQNGHPYIRNLEERAAPRTKKSKSKGPWSRIKNFFRKNRSKVMPFQLEAITETSDTEEDEQVTYVEKFNPEDVPDEITYVEEFNPEYVPDEITYLEKFNPEDVPDEITYVEKFNPEDEPDEINYLGKLKFGDEPGTTDVLVPDEKSAEITQAEDLEHHQPSLEDAVPHVIGSGDANRCGDKDGCGGVEEDGCRAPISLLIQALMKQIIKKSEVSYCPEAIQVIKDRIFENICDKVQGENFDLSSEDLDSLSNKILSNIKITLMCSETELLILMRLMDPLIDDVIASCLERKLKKLSKKSDITQFFSSLLKVLRKPFIATEKKHAELAGGDREFPNHSEIR